MIANADDSENDFFAALWKAYDEAADKERVIREACEQHPELAEEIRKQLEFRRRLEGAASAASRPRRLGGLTILRLLGSGGMGEVYLAEDERLKREVVVKVIREDLDREYADLFLNECQTLAQLHQTHVVPVYAAGEEGPVPYLVMPYLEGASLEHVLQAARQRAAAGDPLPALGEIGAGLLVSGQVLPGTALAGLPLLGPTEPEEVRPRTAAAARPEAPVRDGKGNLPRLSEAYFRSCARVLLDAARALQHVHESGYLHRDVKPANLVVDLGGHGWGIDFGLAARLGEPIANPDAGTPRYLAPEQWAWADVPLPDGLSAARREEVEGRVRALQGRELDVGVDVWGLGVTLYELLALCPAYRVKDAGLLRLAVLTEEPTRPSRLVANVPADLEAICRKALRKEPGERYATAEEFAADLQRWLDGEPTRARPPGPAERLWMWARKNKRLAAALAALTFFVTMAFVLVNELRAAAEQRAARHRRELLVRELERRRADVHRTGWSKEMLDLAAEAARDGKDQMLTDAAASALAGLDARVEKWADKWGASSVAFDRSGRYVAIGGMPAEPAKVWDRTTDQIVHVSTQTGPGPVAFGRDGTPLQLVATGADRRTLRLWDVAKNRLAGEYRLPGEAAAENAYPALAMTPDGTLVAAAVAEGKGGVAVWEVSSGKMVYREAAAVRAIAQSPDGSLVATGDDNGRIRLHTLADGKQAATFRGDRAAIYCLAFQRDRRRRTLERPAVGGWLLAAGDAGGVVTIWDCDAGVPRAACRGANYHIHDVAFSPDGMTMASVGREEVKLWDIATGRLLLDLPATNWMTGVAFSPDGKRLAATGKTAFGTPGLFAVWELETGRGIQTLRGLASRVEKVALSPDERLLAALGQDCRVTVWNVKSEELLHVFEAPRAAWPDNAAIAFSPDGKQLAYAGSSDTEGQVVVWDLATGKQGLSRSLSPGLQNLLAFHPSRKLLLFQVERRDGKRLLDRDTDRAKNPVVGRMRDLLSDPTKLPHEITEFNRRIDFPRLSDDGQVLALVGYWGRDRDEMRRMTARQGTTGKELWSSSPEKSPDPYYDQRLYLHLDHRGRTLAYHRWKSQPPEDLLVELPSGRLLGRSELFQLNEGQGPETSYWAEGTGSSLRIGRRRESEPMVNLVLESNPSGSRKQFDAVGTRFHGGNANGSVTICDIPEVQKRLAALGLGW
jgi:serine/threonine protein kinase/WD40 repeat protein